MSGFHPDDYARARQDHAVFLRLEGLTYSEMEAHLGCCRVRAWQLVRKAAIRWQRAMRRAKFHWEAA